VVSKKKYPVPSSAVLRRDGGHEPQPLAVVDVVAVVEALRTRFRRLEQVAERRHGTVVEVRRPRPDPVERRVGVAVGLVEVGEGVLGAGEQRLLHLGELCGVGRPAVAVGADRLEGLDGAHPGGASRSPSLKAAPAWQARQCSA
jgi:hypothetical protein